MKDNNPKKPALDQDDLARMVSIGITLGLLVKLWYSLSEEGSMVSFEQSSLDELKKMLKNNEEKENYEKCAEIKNLIDKLEKQKNEKV